MEMIPVDSDAIDAIGHDGHNLYVRWNSSGKTHRHDNVPQGVAEQMLAASSKGHYHAKHIRAQYPGKPV